MGGLQPRPRQACSVRGNEGEVTTGLAGAGGARRTAAVEAPGRLRQPLARGAGLTWWQRPSTRLVLALVACTTAAACKRSRDALPPPEAVEDRAHFLALLNPSGQDALDARIRELEARAQHTPTKAEAWVALGQVWVRKARSDGDSLHYLSADACAEVALRLSPGDRGALDVRGLVLLNGHRFEEARILAQSVVDRAPEDASAWGNLSDALTDLGRYRDAARAAQRMMDLKPNLSSYARASYLLWLRGEVTGAKESARLAIDAGGDPRDPEPLAWVLVQAANIFWHEGDYEGAEAGFNRALEAKPDFPPALVGKARVALAQGRPAAASVLLQEAFAKRPLAETAGLLADARRLSGDRTGAEAAEREVFREGRSGDGRTLSLYLSTHGRDADEALLLAERELSTRDDVYTEDALAWALYRKGRLAEARAASDKATALATPDARLLYHAGAIRLASGERPAGVALLKQALALNPGFDPVSAPEAQALLTARAGEKKLARADRGHK
jgi:tetratricopeptide (TPR) repeat protein